MTTKTHRTEKLEGTAWRTIEAGCLPTGEPMVALDELAEAHGPGTYRIVHIASGDVVQELAIGSRATVDELTREAQDMGLYDEDLSVEEAARLGKAGRKRS